MYWFGKRLFFKTTLCEQLIGKFLAHLTPVSLINLRREKFWIQNIESTYYAMRRKISHKFISYFYVRSEKKKLKYILHWK